MSEEQETPGVCPVPAAPGLSGLTEVERLQDYRAAMQLASAGTCCGRGMPAAGTSIPPA